MLQKLKQQHERDGFTIIEVMIVLAIAGLIMVVVFLAVPALQRSSRNTSRKTDVNNILSSISTYQSNSGGSLLSSSNFTSTGALGDWRPSYYASAAVFLQTALASAPTTVSAPGTTGSATVVTTDDVVIVQGAVCGATPSAAPVAGSARSIVAIYAIETSSGNGQYMCQGS